MVVRAILLFILLNGLAQGSVVVKIKKSTMPQTVTFEMQFNQNKVKISSNSNFFNEGNTALLGLFETKYNAFLKHRKRHFEKLAKELRHPTPILSSHKKQASYLSYRPPHQLIVQINGFDVAHYHEEAILSLVSNIFIVSDWKKNKAVEAKILELKKGILVREFFQNHLKREKILPVEKCIPYPSEQFACGIPDYGTAFFRTR